MATGLRNRFLSAMEPEDFSALLPLMREVWLRKGQVLIDQEAEVEDIYFPLSAQLGNLIVFPDGHRVETSVVGSEGMSGLAAFMAEAPCAWQVVVQVPGTALVLRAAALRNRAAESAPLRALLMRLVHDYQAQSAQTTACNMAHRSTAKVARWLLMFHDRSDGATLEITQSELASLLGMQRTTINHAAGELKARGAIKYLRTAIRIADRALLEEASCPCYGMQRKRSRARRLDPPTTTDDPSPHDLVHR